MSLLPTQPPSPPSGSPGPSRPELDRRVWGVIAAIVAAIGLVVYVGTTSSPAPRAGVAAKTGSIPGPARGESAAERGASRLTDDGAEVAPGSALPPDRASVDGAAAAGSDSGSHVDGPSEDEGTGFAAAGAGDEALDAAAAAGGGSEEAALGDEAVGAVASATLDAGTDETEPHRGEPGRVDEAHAGGRFVPAKDRTAQEWLALARDAWEQGDARNTYTYATKSRYLEPLPEAAELATVAACRMKLRDTARTTYRELSGPRRRAAAATCRSFGVRVGL